MKIIDQYTLLPDACRRIKAAANRGIWDGKDRTQYFEDCRWLLQRYPCTIIYTKEYGYHTGGWWKNPDYERCWHLSIAFAGGKEKKALSDILKYIFGHYQSLIWIEPPYTEEGKTLDVWHYRLFCDDNWNPIKPRGEVYNTQFTERGWKSFSELTAR